MNHDTPDIKKEIICYFESLLHHRCPECSASWWTIADRPIATEGTCPQCRQTFPIDPMPRQGITSENPENCILSRSQQLQIVELLDKVKTSILANLLPEPDQVRGESIPEPEGDRQEGSDNGSPC